MTTPASIPNTPVARRQKIVQLLRTQVVRSQAALEEALSAEGLVVTQATLSRDLEELGAIKTRNDDGALVYAVPDGVTARIIHGGEGREARLARVASELLVAAEASGNLVVLRTPPGGAQFLASALDTGAVADVIGTIAGDDTVLVITRSSDGGSAFGQYMKSLAEGHHGNESWQNG